MRIARGTRMRKQKFDLNSETFTLSHAKTNLDRLTQKAMKGEPVYIVRGHERFVLRHVRDIAPMPLRPPGYFTNCYTKEEIELDNRLAKASVIRAPKDLE